MQPEVCSRAALGNTALSQLLRRKQTSASNLAGQWMGERGRAVRRDVEFWSSCRREIHNKPPA